MSRLTSLSILERILQILGSEHRPWSAVCLPPVTSGHILGFREGLRGSPPSLGGQVGEPTLTHLHVLVKMMMDQSSCSSWKFWIRWTR